MTYQGIAVPQYSPSWSGILQSEESKEFSKELISNVLEGRVEFDYTNWNYDQAHEINIDGYLNDIYLFIQKNAKKKIKNVELFKLQFQLFKNAIKEYYYICSYQEKYTNQLISLGENEEAYREWKSIWGQYWVYRPQEVLKIVQFEMLLKRSLVDGDHLYKMCHRGSQLTDFGKRNLNSIKKILNLIILNEFQVSFFEDYWVDYSFNDNSMNPHDFQEYKKFFKYTPQLWKKWESVFNEGSQIPHLKDKKNKAKFELIHSAIESKCSYLLREAENKYRLSIGAKKIGESWISETELFYKLKKSLQEEVIHHGRPNWLGRQHFDIWIPELNVAIEYQGKQHDQPIEFFGGEEAFKENQKRDARKKKKCEENNVRLIEVREGYVLDELVKHILE